MRVGVLIRIFNFHEVILLNQEQCIYFLVDLKFKNEEKDCEYNVE